MKRILITTITLVFVLSAKAQTADTTKTKPTTVTIGRPAANGQIYTAVETVPEFPGGSEAFYHFLSANIQYPESARKNKQQGRVIVMMVIEKDGSLVDIKIARGVSPDMDAEALRVMKLCPKWKPGTQNGQPIRVAYSVPISFTLDK